MSTSKETHSWVEAFARAQETRRHGEGLAADDIPAGPPLGQRTDMDRPAYWYTDFSAHPNARFDLAYVQKDPHPAQKLQLLYPEGFTPGRDAPLPLVIFVHGGGFAGGNTKADGRKVLYTVESSVYALQHGYAVAIVDYRLRPEVEIMPIIHDLKAAIRYLRANAAALGVDADRFALVGESAGGYLVSIAGVTGDHPDFEDKDMGYADASTSVRAVISWYAPQRVDPGRSIDRFYNDADKRFTPEIRTALARFLSTHTHINKKTPPFFLQHGTKDETIDYHSSIDFHKDLCAATGEAQNRLELVPEADHAVRWFITRENGEKMVRWLDQYMK